MSKPARRVSRRRHWRRRIGAASSPAERLRLAADYLRAMARSAIDPRDADKELDAATDHLMKAAEKITIRESPVNQ
jgi:hypothetical protein